MKVTILLMLVQLGPLVLAQESDRLTNIRQLTQGGQNAEAYWSPDGKHLVFQSTRDGAKCDQIYVMNADGNELKRISNGQGVTTCGYSFPTANMCSTPPRTPKASPAWLDLTAPRVTCGPCIPLTTFMSRTWMARLSKSSPINPVTMPKPPFNGKARRIIYISKASGDLDLWTADLDGSHKKQITRFTGYDGGGVFSRDGRKIVWRAHHPQPGPDLDKYKQLLEQNLTTPMKMELFVASADGADAKQITNFGCASFAPQFTPDGKRIIFSSNKNKCDSRDFELFVIDVDGANLRQVTSFAGFTSFPEFSPDGKQLVFTSSWKAKSPYEFNIFVADWKE